jgi:arylsulfatase A-like enzyme
MNGIPLDPLFPTFTEALRKAGYQTHCTGKIHLNNSAPPNGIHLDEVDPSQYPECRPLWLNGTITDLPTPYYGLESVDFVSGHGHNSYGHYVQWLEREHPGSAKKFHEQIPLEPPSEAYKLFNRSSYKWALPPEHHPMTWIADRSIDFLDIAGKAQRAGKGRPFMLMCSIQEPHPPFAPPAPYCYRYDPKDIPPPLGRKNEYDDLPPHFRLIHETPLRTSGNHSQSMNATTPFYAECVGHYLGLIEMLDDQVGRVMDALHTNGLKENTVVMFLADHGEALGDHGMWGKGPYHIDSVIRVPFFASWPGKFPSGTLHEGSVSLLDMAPTVLDLANIPIPEGSIPADPEALEAPPALPGRSLVPILTGEDTETDTIALVEMDEDYLGFKMRTLVTQRYRLTVYSGEEYGELFDLHEDPYEENNLWSDPTQKQLCDNLQKQLLHKLIETDISLPRQLSRA